MHSHKSTTRLVALRRSLTRPGESARALSTRSQRQQQPPSRRLTLREQPLTLRCPLTPSRRPALGLRVTRRLVAVVLAYCHMAATSAGNLPLSSPVGFAMEATATGTPGLSGRTGPTGGPAAWPQRPVPPCHWPVSHKLPSRPSQTPASKAGAAAGARPPLRPGGHWQRGPAGSSAPVGPGGLRGISRRSDSSLARSLLVATAP
jgi:hypothetical protein